MLMFGAVTSKIDVLVMLRVCTYTTTTSVPVLHQNMASVNPDPCPVYIKISENWQSFILYIALFKEYKNINFVIKRNMVESNEVT